MDLRQQQQQQQQHHHHHHQRQLPFSVPFARQRRHSPFSPAPSTPAPVPAPPASAPTPIPGSAAVPFATPSSKSSPPLPSSLSAPATAWPPFSFPPSSSPNAISTSHSHSHNNSSNSNNSASASASAAAAAASSTAPALASQHVPSRLGSPGQNPPAYAVANFSSLQRPPPDSPSQSSAPQPRPTDSTAAARAAGSSSLPSLRYLNPAMPPPPSSASPPQPGAHQPPPPAQQGQQQQGQQQQQQQPPSQSHSMMGYGPPPPRPPPVAVGPPMSFPSGRELPALSSITRSGSSGSSMSISSMLGGPPAPRDSQPPPSHYPPPSSTPGSGPAYAPAVHASPRMHSANSDYPPFRRPQTPDHQRPYDPRASPPPGHYSTPDVQRYGTPSAYHSHSRHPSASADHAREPGRLPPGPPPRPSSQPKVYSGMPPRPMEMGRGPPPEEGYGRRDEMGRPAPGMEYNPERVGLRPYPYDDRYRMERERQGEAEQRERERRDRAYSGSDSGRQHPMHPGEYSSRNPTPYGRPPEPRDPRDTRDNRDPRDVRDPRDPRDPRDQRDPRDPHWGRQGPDVSYRAPMDHQRPPHPDYPPSSGPYAPHGPQYQAPPNHDRYPPNTQHPPPPPQNAPSAPQPYDSPDRARMNMLHPQGPPPQHQHQQPPPQPPQQQPPQQPPPQHRPGEEAPPPTIAYNGAQGPAHFDNRHRSHEDHSAGGNGQRNLLAIQEMNRKGRVSPLPQAVQGAQLQQPGPTGEPTIKSEFGRMFAGIGNGLIGGVSSPITSHAMPFSNAGAAKREDSDNATPDPGPDNGKPKGRRRKLKEEDATNDDGSGRLTPSGRAKKAKTHAHHHHHHHAHHHHHHPPDQASQPPGSTSFKGFKGPAGGPAAADRNAQGAHNHQAPRPAHAHASPTKPAVQAAPTIPPKTKTIVSSKAVLESVSNRPRHHLGDFIYEPGLKASRLVPHNPASRGFSSNPKPLPWEMVKGKENCTLTIKVSRVHLSHLAREEITSRGYLWGTDVYTDDSDVVAASIHSGWIKGEWTEDVDSSNLTLDDKPNGETKRRKAKASNPTVDLESEGLITTPPTSGPMSIPPQRDLHVNILILPRLIKYSSSTRNGITSREFGGDYGARHAIHDGLSYMIKSVRWVENGAQPQARLRGKARRERMRKAMGEVKGNLENASGEDRELEKEIMSRLRGEIAGTFWKKDREAVEKKDSAAGEGRRSGSEGNKENRPDADKDVPEEAPTAEATGDAKPAAADKDADMVDAEQESAVNGTKEQ